MKWVVIASFLMYLATFSEGNALRCLRGIKNGCLIGNTDKVKKSHAECLSGSEWESSCHKCRCSDLGHAECTLLDACEKGEYEEHMVCKPNTTFKRDCNICRCLENGKGSYCTEKACLQFDQSVQSPELQDGLDCLPGSRWMSQCNNCTCSPDGYPTCTERLCPGQENEIKFSCAPHTSWKIECNNCSCTPNGRAYCTRMGCDMFDATDFNPEVDESQKPEEESDHKSVNHNIVKRSRNFCKCASSGESYSCTLNECLEQDEDEINVGRDNDKNSAHNIGDDVEVFMRSEEGADHIERHSVCKPRGTFRIGCNTCLCNIDGTDFTCTNKPCPLPDDVEVFHELKVLRTSNKKSVICPANRMFIKDCNTCWCNEDGTSYFCTRRVCINELPESEVESVTKPEETKPKCQPDEVFELDCNMCRCAVDGKSFSCTRKACFLEDEGKNVTLSRKIRATPQGTLKSCQPGQEFRMDCNKCLCNNEGQDYSCTRIDCAALNSNGNSGARTKREVATQLKTNCKPGTVFNQDCNTCRCTEDGNHATCTVKRCKEDKPDENELNLPESDPSFRCNPGEQFKKDCNDCTCSADGKSVFCTLRLCDVDISTTI